MVFFFYLSARALLSRVDPEKQSNKLVLCQEFWDMHFFGRREFEKQKLWREVKLPWIIGASIMGKTLEIKIGEEKESNPYLLFIRILYPHWDRLCGQGHSEADQSSQ